MVKKIINTNEFVAFIIIVLLSLFIGLINPAFFSIATIFDTLRSSIVYIILAFGLLPVMIIGGLDISFVAIGALSAYATHMLLLNTGYQGGVFLYYVIACTIGVLASLLNSTLVTKFDLNIFNVSLALYIMWYGFIRFFIGSKRSATFPEGASQYYSKFIWTVKDPLVGNSSLHESILFVVVIGILLTIILKYTTFGRGIYAIGGNREVAIRTGFKVNKILTGTFIIMGALAAFAGVTYSFLVRIFDPTMFLGEELDVIAAVILGGASINGGKGSVIGTFMGVILIQLIHHSIILIGIPVIWQDLIVGFILIINILMPYLKKVIKKILDSKKVAYEEAK